MKGKRKEKGKKMWEKKATGLPPTSLANSSLASNLTKRAKKKRKTY